MADEVEIFHAAYEERIPLLFKGPTGCGKTRFVEYMAYKLGEPLTVVKPKDTQGAQSNGTTSLPLVTVACHEDLTASDLVGRYLLEGDRTVWVDGPLSRAVKAGGICYLDEVVEARKDTTVLIHPLTDHRRILPVEKRGELLEAADNFLLVISYNPGYQSALKDLKHSTRQRFVAIEFDYPPKDVEQEVIAHESGCSIEAAKDLAKLGEKGEEPPGARAPGGGQHPTPDLRGQVDQEGHSGASGLPGGGGLGPVGRHGSPAQRGRSGVQHIRVIENRRHPSDYAGHAYHHFSPRGRTTSFQQGQDAGGSGGSGAGGSYDPADGEGRAVPYNLQRKDSQG